MSEIKKIIQRFALLQRDSGEQKNIYSTFRTSTFLPLARVIFQYKRVSEREIGGEQNYFPLLATDVL